MDRTNREQQEHSIVEETEAKMVPFNGSREPITRKAWFLKPNVSNSLNPPFPPPRFQPISLDSTEPPKVLFEGWMSPQPQWPHWVNKLKPKYKDLWQKVGIFDAIMASTYKICKDPASILGVIVFWCEETNTFLFPWGEATVTLEDVVILGGFSVLGEPVRASEPLEGGVGEIEHRMVIEIRKFYQSKSKKAEHYEWVKHYMEGGGDDDDELEHIAFLSLWLSRFVFPSPPSKTVKPRVFSIAIRLAQGVRIALAPAVLASLYRDLRAVKNHLTGRHWESPLVVCALFNILQLWAWERFLALRPDSPRFINFNEPRAARWDNMMGNKLSSYFVRHVLQSLIDEFQWRPYTITLDNWRKPSFYKDSGQWVCGNALGDDEFASFARCLRACELVGLDCIEQYLPHRVSMQFGLDQGIPNYVPRADSTWENAWETYDISTKNAKFYVPSRLFESDITFQYYMWWKKVERVLRKRMVENKRKKDQHSRHIKKKKLIDFYETPPCQSVDVKPHEPNKHVKMKLSLKHSETMCQNSHFSSETQIKNSTQGGEVVAFHPVDIDKIRTTTDVKKNNARECANELIEIEEPEEIFEAGNVEECSKEMDKESDSELEIRKLKEEIASIQARILDLEREPASSDL